MKCLRCGAELRIGAVWCTECGYKVPERMRTAGKAKQEDGSYRYTPKQEKDSTYHYVFNGDKEKDGSYRYVPNREERKSGTAQTSPKREERNSGTGPTPPKREERKSGTSPTPPKREERKSSTDQTIPKQENQRNGTGQQTTGRETQGKPVKKKTGSSWLKKLLTAVKNILLAGIRLMLITTIVVVVIEWGSSLLDELGSKREIPEITESTTAATTVPTEYVPSVQTDYTFYSIQEIKNTLAPTCIDEELDVTIRYKGDANDIGILYGGQLFGGRSGGVSALEPEVFRIVASPYAGSKMLKAYRTGDYSNLTADEQEALYVAEAVVAAARKEASNDMELELWLHDWMCRNISYYNVDFSIEFSDRRQLNAVGALLDGKVNCQGYTDCFYLLGNMAGFTVDRQVMPEHIFNTIKLGENWYMVDVTHDDYDQKEFGRDMIRYRWFNVGMDYSSGRSWDERLTRNRISDFSGQYFYYHLTDSNGYNKLYDSIDVLADNVLYAYHSGNKTFHGMLLGAQYTHEELFAAMERVARKKGIGYGASYVIYDNGPDNTIYSVVFE